MHQVLIVCLFLFFFGGGGGGGGIKICLVQGPHGVPELS